MELSALRTRRRRAAAAGDSRELILSAARERFLRFGPRKTTMEEISRDAGCSRATVYLHFSSKEQLYARMLEHEIDSLVLRAQALMARPGDFFGKFLGLSRLWIWSYRNNPILRGTLADDPELTLRGVAAEAQRAQDRRLIDLVRRCLDEDVANGVLRKLETERVATFVVQLIAHFVERELNGQNAYPFKQMTDLVAEILDTGLTHGRGRAVRSQR